MDSPPPVITTEDVINSLPPPSYEDIMGHQAQTSAKTDVSKEELPPLAYIDIMPRCLHPGNMKGRVPPEYDKFSTLIQASNHWLRENPMYGVWKCETVERKVEPSGEVIMESMLFHEATYGFNVYINGIRLWLYARDKSSSPPQQLGLYSRVPDKVSIPFAFYGRRRFHGPALVQTIASYEGLRTTVDKLNKELKSKPIGGTILTVECAVIKAAEGYEKLDVDPDNTVFHENGGKSRRYTQILRIFYIIGTSAQETFELIDVIPKVTHKPGMGTPARFETYDETLERLSKNPPSELKEGRIVNIQTHISKYREVMGEVDVLSNDTDDFVFGTAEGKQLQIIRIFKVNGSSTNSFPPGLSTKLFLPVRTGPKSFENMQQTMYRIEAWLRATGVPVYTVDTVSYLFKQHSPLGVDNSKSNVISPAGVGKHFVTAIRVYFSQPFQEPDPALLPPVYPWTPSSGSSSCSIL
ncbi:uncharacterized protein LOC134260480 [Saccostrea cucullata]|uniref:uncharacterized protein LOC134260480 n=1 Tax=Saccostrea cuccullata TaxID=36930 RepID=UPI002ED081EE